MTDMTPVLHAATMTLLRGIGTVAAFDADVPPHPPADPTGRVYPYAVLWPGAGAHPIETAITGSVGTDWLSTVTVAAGDVGWCLDAVALVRSVLDGAALAPGVTLSDVTSRARTLQRDPDITPTRWYVPLLFTALTP